MNSSESINTQYTPTSIYQIDKIYYWRVAIRDRSGRQGPFTDASYYHRGCIFHPSCRWLVDNIQALKVVVFF